MVDLGTALRYYKRTDIQEAIVGHAKDKEIAVSFNMKGFGKRPDILTYPRDVIELVKQGATSFHCSEELWKNPLHLNPNLRRAELDSLRQGWDLILDIDCPFLEYSAIAAHFLIQALDYHGVGSLSVKFSGNHGFHIAVPFEAFPEKVHDKDTKDLFPEGPRRIALYLKEMIRDHLAEGILKKDNMDALVKKTEKKFSELVKDGKFDPFTILDVDTILISSRHLYRMSYSFNEKSGLVSIPVEPNKVLEFKKEDSVPEKIKVTGIGFLDRTKVKPNEARKLIVQAFDFKIEKEDEDEFKLIKKKEFDMPQMALKEDFFPPCIKNILSGLEDGKKRSMFVLTNFLSNVGWEPDKIGELLKEWNKKNPEPLREVYLVGHLRYTKKQKKKIMPPNCDNKGYYQDMHLCTPDALCKKIKNPVNYSIRKTYYLRHNKDGRKKEQKETKSVAVKEENKTEEKQPVDQT